MGKIGGAGRPIEWRAEATKGRPLRYKVLDGETIKASFPFIWDLYNQRMLDLVREHAGPEIDLLSNQKVGEKSFQCVGSSSCANH